MGVYFRLKEKAPLDLEIFHSTAQVVYMYKERVDLDDQEPFVAVRLLTARSFPELLPDVTLRWSPENDFPDFLLDISEFQQIFQTL